MKNLHKKFVFPIILALAAVFLIPSCELKDPDDYELFVIVMGSGSNTSITCDCPDPDNPGSTQPCECGYNTFTTTTVVDNKPPLTFSSLPTINESDNTILILPAGKAKIITMTAQRKTSDSTLSIMVYKDNELDEKGVAILPTCNTSSTTTCSNTKEFIYKVDQDDTDDTKSASASSSSSSSE